MGWGWIAEYLSAYPQSQGTGGRKGKEHSGTSDRLPKLNHAVLPEGSDFQSDRNWRDHLSPDRRPFASRNPLKIFAWSVHASHTVGGTAIIFLLPQADTVLRDPTSTSAPECAWY
jgi:hypothetical protein